MLTLRDDGLNSYCKECEKKNKHIAFEKTKEANKNKVIDPAQTKTCADCKQIKTLANFHKSCGSLDGIGPYCKGCKSKQKKEYALKCETKVAQANYKPTDPKYCHHCETDKTRADFYDCRGLPDGLQAVCIDCSKNRENTSTNARARRERISNYAPIPESAIIGLLDYSKHKCFYCGIDVKRGINLHMDHKVPIARGGPHTIENLAVSCDKCNLRKHAMTDTEFLELLKQREQMLIKTGDIKEAGQEGGFVKTGDAQPITHILSTGELENADDTAEAFDKLKEETAKQKKAG